jgi:hypothetical protein
MMAMTKLLADVLKLSPSRFNPTSHARFLAVHLGHAIVRINTSSMVKTRYAHPSFYMHPSLQCMLQMSLAM